MSARTPFNGLDSGECTRPVQAARRAYVRALAEEAATVLAELGEADDVDGLMRLVDEALEPLQLARLEILRAHLA